MVERTATTGTIKVYDFFRTLAGWKPNDQKPAYEVVFEGLGIATKAIYPKVRDCLMTDPNLRTYYDLVEKLAHELGLRMTRPALEHTATLWREWDERCDWLPYAPDIIGKERQLGNTLVLATNMVAPAWSVLNQKLGIGLFFDSVFKSFELQVAKPSVHFFKAIEERYHQRRPAEFWMHGDSQTDDLDVPKSMAWGTKLFAPDGSALQKHLEALRAL